MGYNNDHDLNQPRGPRAEPRVGGYPARVSKVFKCGVCLKVLSSKHCLQEHQYIHTNEKPYHCIPCMKSFKYASQFSTHKKQHLVFEELRWPKLTDLIRPTVYQQDLPEPMPVIELPPIKGPSLCELPKFRLS